MLFPLLTLLSAGYSVKASHPASPPVIDGVLEELWAEADSLGGFIQTMPNEGKPVSEPTTVWLLADEGALYVAYLCETPGRQPDARLSERDEMKGDHVFLVLDTFDDDRTGYSFLVSAAGVQGDEAVSQDGRVRDDSWEGAWYSAVKVYDWGYVVELAIPFKAVRHGTGSWGVNFGRYIPGANEESYWAPMLQNEGFRVSRMGELTGLTQKAKGLNLELYPVALSGYSLPPAATSGTGVTFGPEGRAFADAGLDVDYYPSPGWSLQATLNPDFAQIESDPFLVNTGRYELFFEERRPFFIEGKELFDLPLSSRHSSPLSLFYTRRIGESFSGGARSVWRNSFLEGAALFTRAEELVEVDSAGDTLSYYPGAHFGALRLRKPLFGTSTAGLLGAASEGFDTTFNRVAGADLVLDRGDGQLALVGAGSQTDSDNGGLVNVRGQYSGRKFHGFLLARWVTDSFDVSGVGYFPYSGQRFASLALGPSYYPGGGPLRELGFELEAGVQKELFEDSLSVWGGFSSWFDTRSGWGSYQYGGLNRDYEQGTYAARFDKPYFGFGVWSPWANRWGLNCNFDRSYGYNYLRGWFAYQMSFSGSVRITLRDGTEAELDGFVLLEEDTAGGVENVFWTVRPSLFHAISAVLNVTLQTEVALSSPGAWGGTLSTSVTNVFVVAFNPRPKSWIYVVFRSGAEREYDYFAGRYGGPLLTYERGFTAKVRYLVLI